MNTNMINNSSQALQLEILKMKIHECHTDNMTHSSIENDTMPYLLYFMSSGKFCNKIFDGLLCWDDTPAGELAYQNCPANIYGWSPQRRAYKQCNPDGTWYTHPTSTRPWTNYTTCVDMDDFLFRERLIKFSIVCYSISFICLCTSIAIFYTYNLVNSVRTKVHMNLFISLALNCVSWVLWYLVIVRNATVLMDSSYSCCILTMVNLYLMCCSYMWMFCEGLNLYLSLVVVFVNQELAMKVFMFIGWIVPLILTGVYYACRLYLGDIERCMIDESHAFYVVTIPVGITMLFSLYFFVRIMVVLVNKARNQPGAAGVVQVSGPNSRFDILKTMKPVILLVPLFGLYFLLVPMQPPPGTTFETAYSIVLAMLTGLQGSLVSVLFCFRNEEVINHIKHERERSRRIRFEMNQINAATTSATVESGYHAERRM